MNGSTRHRLFILLFIGLLLLSVTGLAVAQRDRTTPSLPDTLENFDGDWEDAIEELEELEVIASGGSLVFQEDYAFFSGRGQWATPLGRNSPNTDIIMAGELTYEVGSTREYETCSLMARIEVEGSQISKGLEVGIDNDGDVYYFDVYGSGRNDYYQDYSVEGMDLDDPHHILFIASGETLNVYLDGELAIEDAPVDEREGIYGILMSGRGEEARCEGRNIWVYQALRFEPGVCKILAANTVNRRAGPGTTFAQMGKMQAGDSVLAIAQAEDSSGAVWWQLEDESWVREDVVTAQGDCRSLPEAELGI